MRQNFFVKIYELFRYKLPRFFSNIWVFRKSLWDFRWYDYHYTLMIMQTSLDVMANNIEKKGIEVDSSRLKKVAKMKRAVEIIHNMDGIHHLEMAEKELGKLFQSDWEFVPEGNDLYSMKDNLPKKQKEHNKKVFDRSREIETQEWEELWEIFKGQKHEEYSKSNGVEWDDWFDGSGMNTWWD